MDGEVYEVKDTEAREAVLEAAKQAAEAVEKEAEARAEAVASEAEARAEAIESEAEARAEDVHRIEREKISCYSKEDFPKIEWSAYREDRAPNLFVGENGSIHYYQKGSGAEMFDVTLTPTSLTVEGNNFSTKMGRSELVVRAGVDEVFEISGNKICVNEFRDRFLQIKSGGENLLYMRHHDGEPICTLYGFSHNGIKGGAFYVGDSGRSTNLFNIKTQAKFRLGLDRIEFSIPKEGSDQYSRCFMVDSQKNIYIGSSSIIYFGEDKYLSTASYCPQFSRDGGASRKDVVLRDVIELYDFSDDGTCAYSCSEEITLANLKRMLKQQLIRIRINNSYNYNILSYTETDSGIDIIINLIGTAPALIEMADKVLKLIFDGKSFRWTTIGSRSA